MDPNEALSELRKLAKHVHETTDGIDNYTDRLVLHDLTEEAENFAQLFDGLDQWLAKSGFAPREWTHNIDLSSYDDAGLTALHKRVREELQRRTST